MPISCIARKVSATLFLVLLALSFSSVTQAATRLTVYTAIEPELLGLYARALSQKHKDITIDWVRDSAGPIAARLLAEKDAPKADVVFGIAVSALLPLAKQDMLTPYTPKGLEHMIPGTYDSGTPPLWVGTNGWATGICANTKVLQKKGLPLPKNLNDLVSPIYKGQVVMASPVSSSSAYTDVAAWLQTMGEDAGWQFMEDLHKNIALYTHSGSKPAQMVAQGEFALGLSAPAFARPYQARKAPLVMIAQKEGVGWDLEAAALIKGGKNAEVAKKMIDFATSQEVARIGAEHGYIPVRTDITSPEIEATRKSLRPFDPAKVSSMRSDVLAKWRKRFDAGK